MAQAGNGEAAMNGQSNLNINMRRCCSTRLLGRPNSLATLRACPGIGRPVFIDAVLRPLPPKSELATFIHEIDWSIMQRTHTERPNKRARCSLTDVQTIGRSRPRALATSGIRIDWSINMSLYVPRWLYVRIDWSINPHNAPPPPAPATFNQ